MDQGYAHPTQLQLIAIIAQNFAIGGGERVKVAGFYGCSLAADCQILGARKNAGDAIDSNAGWGC